MTFQELCNQLEAKIISGYTSGVSMEEAERLAGEFLAAQFQISAELQKAALDARMRKNSVKSLRGQVYREAATAGEKKPTEAMLAALLDTNDEVKAEQLAYDAAETEAENLVRLYNTFKDAHIFYRGIAKGNFNG